MLKSEYMPEILGTIRAKYEYEPQIDKGRFEIRNTRLNVEGKIIPIVRYKAEYLRKLYAHHSFKAVNAVVAFTAYGLPLKKGPAAISSLGRYDYMSDHNKGSKDDNGQLVIDDPQRHRLTGGVTLSLGKKDLQADIRLNYEQYFYKKGVTPLISEQNKIVVEFVARF